GLSLVARQEKVCLFDADTGLANVNILMGVSPHYTIEHVLNGSKTIEEIIIELPNGIFLVPAASGIKQCTNLDNKQLSCLITALQSLEKKFDYLLIDTAAGIDTNVLDFVASAQYRVLVITPEPTSLTDSFALLKMLVIRGKKQSMFVLVNKVENYKSSQLIFKRFQQAVKTYLKIDVAFFGYLAVDTQLNKAIAQQVPVVLSYPNSAISCGFASLADIIKRQFRNNENLPYFSQYWLTNNKQAQSIKSKPAAKTQNKLIPAQTKTEAQKEASLSDIYSLLNEQTLTEQELKELVVTLESVYEKKHKKPIRDINSTVALILAEGDAKKIQKMHSAIAHSYERQFNKKINSPTENIVEALTDESLSKAEFNRLMEIFSDIYQQRFNERYFGEGNLLLTKIQALLTKKE
ncbi:MAG: AAA family ATPase, partial [Methyloprofundus sp.]|nr:AAA family ATPase [Methyloprofundus sp.]